MMVSMEESMEKGLDKETGEECISSPRVMIIVCYGDREVCL